MNSFKEVESFVRESQVKRTIVVAGAHDQRALEAVSTAVQNGFVTAVLIGDACKIESLIKSRKMQISDCEIIDEKDERAAIDRAVTMVKEGKADIPMKGLMQTSTFMKGILNKEAGFLGEGELLSQASIFEVPETERFLIVSDCAVNIEPDINQKIKIIENAVGVAGHLGIVDPKIALISALEKVNPKIKNTVDAEIIAKELKDMYHIAGPLALDNAVSVEAAQHKGIDDPVAGRADILIVPDMWSGNIFTKGLVFFAHLKSAGTLNGLKSPVVMTSRTDTSENKYYSILMSVLSSIQ